MYDLDDIYYVLSDIKNVLERIDDKLDNLDNLDKLDKLDSIEDSLDDIKSDVGNIYIDMP